MFRHLARAACVLGLGAGTAWAGDVSGKLELPAAPRLPEPAYKGFLDRAENASLPPRAFDPSPYLVVVLVPATPAQGSGGSATWDLAGDSFARPLLPVRAGTEVTIRNKSQRAVGVTASDPKLIAGGPINPNQTRPFTVTAPGLVVVTGDTDLPHLRGRLVVLDTPFFATPDREGRFTIKDVAPGEYQVRVWYLDGWLDRPDDAFSMPAKGDGAVSPKLTAYKVKAS